MIKKLLLPLLLLIPIQANAFTINGEKTLHQDSFHHNHNRIASEWGLGYRTCVYKTGFGRNAQRIQITTKGFCPLTIKYNPVTNTWRK